MNIVLHNMTAMPWLEYGTQTVHGGLKVCNRKSCSIPSVLFSDPLYQFSVILLGRLDESTKSNHTADLSIFYFERLCAYKWFYILQSEWVTYDRKHCEFSWNEGTTFTAMCLLHCNLIVYIPAGYSILFCMPPDLFISVCALSFIPVIILLKIKWFPKFFSRRKLVFSLPYSL